MTSTDHDTGGPPTFDLRALVREVAAESDAADPAVLAKEVEQRIRDEQHHDALVQALPLAVYHLARTSAPASTPRPDQKSSEAHVGAVGARPHPSSKVAAIRSWSRHLRDRVSVGPDSWKFLGDCTPGDLGYAAALRDDLARANAARATWLRQLADLVAEHDVVQVDQLPDDVLAGHLGGGA